MYHGCLSFVVPAFVVFAKSVSSAAVVKVPGYGVLSLSFCHPLHLDIWGRSLNSLNKGGFFLLCWVPVVWLVHANHLELGNVTWMHHVCDIITDGCMWCFLRHGVDL
jgi:hypothetical protein